jgi:hypothetical protein
MPPSEMPPLPMARSRVPSRRLLQELLPARWATGFPPRISRGEIPD